MIVVSVEETKKEKKKGRCIFIVVIESIAHRNIGKVSYGPIKAMGLFFTLSCVTDAIFREEREHNVKRKQKT